MLRDACNRVTRRFDSGRMIPQVTCYCDTDLVHAAYVTTGLIELADAGEIELKFRLRAPRPSSPRSVWTIWLQVRNGIDDCGVCIDSHDLPQFHCPVGLAACRYYFKTNIDVSTRDAFPSKHLAKLRAFGPYLPVRPLHERSLSLRRWGCFYAKARALLPHLLRRQCIWQTVCSVVAGDILPVKFGLSTKNRRVPTQLQLQPVRRSFSTRLAGTKAKDRQFVL